MNISSASMDSYLIASAMNQKSASVQGEITMAVMKQAQDSEKVFADALVQMISQPIPRPDGTGSIINIAA